MGITRSGKTELFAQWLQGSLTVSEQGFSTGDRFWVHSGTGSDTVGCGKNPQRPFATLDYAIEYCTANHGDIIYVLPGHLELLDADSAVDVDIAGLKIIGLGWGGSRPTFMCTVVAGDFKLASSCNVVENLLFINAVDNSTGLFEVTGTDNTIRYCEFREADDAEFADVFLLTVDGADRLHIHDCKFIGNVGDGSVSAIELIGADHAHIHDCYLYGNYDTGVIQYITTASAGTRIHDCTIWQLDDTAGAAGVQMILDTITTSTGVMGPNLNLVGIVNAANITEAVTGATFNVVDPVYVVNAVAEKAMLINWAASAD